MNVKGLVRGLLLFIPSFTFAQDVISAIADDKAPSIFTLDINDLLNVRVVTAAAGFEQNVEEAPA